MLHPDLAKQIEIARLTRQIAPLMVLMRMVGPYAEELNATAKQLEALGADPVMLAEAMPPLPPMIVIGLHPSLVRPAGAGGSNDV